MAGCETWAERGARWHGVIAADNLHEKGWTEAGARRPAFRFATVQREHWYLVIVNDSSRPAHVFYEVKW